MNDESLHPVEQQLACLQPRRAPAETRATVLADVRRELRAGRGDRWLVRAAAVLLAMGVGLNGAIVVRSGWPARGGVPLADDRAPRSLAETAVQVADATDAVTGRLLTRHLMALSGRQLGVDEAAAIDGAIEDRNQRTTTNGGDG